MAPALKEWAVVVHALLEGEQILDVRKGGLHEDGRHFAVQSNRLWLYPTAEHQKGELLKEPYRHWIDLASASPVGEPIRLDGWADVVRVATITEPEQLDAIASKLIWTDEYAAVTVQLEEARPSLGARAARAPARRADHGALARGVRRLHVVGRPRRACPPTPRRCASEPALSDVAFDARLKGAVEALPALAEPRQLTRAAHRATRPTRRWGAPEGAPHSRNCWKSPADGTRGGDQLPPVRRRCGGQTPQAVQRSCKPGLAAAHLQGPVMFMHVWTTSFPWYEICTTRRSS